MSPPNSSSLQHNKRRKLSTANSADASEDDSANVPSAKDSIGDDDSDNNNLNNAATATSLDLPSNNNGASLVDNNNNTANNIGNDNSTAAATCDANNNHYIQQTVAGPVCTHPNCLTKIGQKLIVTDDTIRAHWKKNECYKCTEIPNASQVEKDQELHLVSIHERIRLSPLRGEEIVNESFPPGCKMTNTAYCSRCGYNDKPARVKKHIDAKK